MSWHKKEHIFIMYRGTCPNCGRHIESFSENEKVKCCLDIVVCDYAFDSGGTKKGSEIADRVNRGYTLKEAWEGEKEVSDAEFVENLIITYTESIEPHISKFQALKNKRKRRSQRETK